MAAPWTGWCACADCVTDQDVLRVAGTLAHFYRDAAPVGMGLEEYRQRFARGVRDLERDLGDPRHAIAAGEIRELTRDQLSFLGQKAPMSDQRQPPAGAAARRTALTVRGGRLSAAAGCGPRITRPRSILN